LRPAFETAGNLAGLDLTVPAWVKFLRARGCPLCTSSPSKSAGRRSGMRASPLVLGRAFEILPPGPDAFGRLQGQLLGRARLKNRGAGCACGGIFRGFRASLRRRRRSGSVNCASSAVSAGQGDGAPRLGRSGTLETAGFGERIQRRDSSSEALSRLLKNPLDRQKWGFREQVTAAIPPSVRHFSSAKPWFSRRLAR